MVVRKNTIVKSTAKSSTWKIVNFLKFLLPYPCQVRQLMQMQGAIEGNISSSAFRVVLLKYGDTAGLWKNNTTNPSSASRNPSVEYWSRDSSGGLEFNVLVSFALINCNEIVSSVSSFTLYDKFLIFVQFCRLGNGLDRHVELCLFLVLNLNAGMFPRMRHC